MEAASAPLRAPLCAVFVACLRVAIASAAPESGQPPQAGGPPGYAEAAPLAASSLLIAIARAGERLVAVGDRGVIVLSDDRGGSWLQAARVPSEALLTGVCFFDPRHGIAVGHDEVILTTADGGRQWLRAHYQPAAQGPLLDVWCGAGGTAIAVGAYGAYLTSTDAGASWSARRFAALPATRPPGAAAGAAAEGDDTTAGGGFHLNRIVAASAARLYIAAEAGHLYRSDDAGATWRELPSPYAGSFFDVLPLGSDVLLAFGMRGNLYRSENAGESWRRLDTATVQMLDGAARLAGNELAIVGLSGVVLVSHDAGESFSLQQQADRSGLSAALAAGPDTLVVVGEDGARRIGLRR